ncbi:MAG: rRNA maturation RNase YbeY [Firmicutes bacterium]|nr:rRNA maturation RNase YbeY [Bacillota bacterium]
MIKVKMKSYYNIKKLTGKKTFYFDKFEISADFTDQFLCLDDFLNMVNVIKETLHTANYNYYTQISLSIVSESQIRELNRDFRGIDSVTDVLSFPLDFEEGILGDVVLCKKRCLKQSKTFGNSFNREMVYLTCHSILHLLGYDHMNKRDKKIMRSLEKEVMKKVYL